MAANWSGASPRVSRTDEARNARQSGDTAKAVKPVQDRETSKAARGGTSAKRVTRGASTRKSTTTTGSKGAARSRVVTKENQTRADGRFESAERVERVRGGRPERVRVERLDAAERAKLRELHALVSGRQDLENTVVVDPAGRRVSLNSTLLEGLAALGRVVEALERGRSVTVVADDQAELTSQETADLLNVSRPYVVKLARAGVLAHHRVGNRHRFTLADVLDYRDRMHSVREEALGELAPAEGYAVTDF